MVNSEIILHTLIERIQKEKDVISIRSRFGKGYERPDTITLKGKKKMEVIPDLLVKYEHRTDVYVIAQSATDDIIKWRLLSLYAMKMDGTCYIVAPLDFKASFSKILETKAISARIIGF